MTATMVVFWALVAWVVVVAILRVIFEEEWHGHRYAVRDLDVIDTRRA